MSKFKDLRVGDRFTFPNSVQVYYRTRGGYGNGLGFVGPAHPNDEVFNMGPEERLGKDVPPQFDRPEEEP